MIVVLEMGNVGSIVNMLKKIGEKAIVSDNDEVIQSADKMILPGVGSFDVGMAWLNASGLAEKIRRHAILAGKPLLGICLGMQMLGQSSEEGQTAGLGLIPFQTRRFRMDPENSGLKIPHMGWDVVSFTKKDSPLLYGLTEPQRYYFVHSYHAVCDNEDNLLMTCDYGYTFAAAVQKNHIYGVQFHPEKSHHFGMALLKNFVERC